MLGQGTVACFYSFRWSEPQIAVIPRHIQYSVFSLSTPVDFTNSLPTTKFKNKKNSWVNLAVPLLVTDLKETRQINFVLFSEDYQKKNSIYI